MFTPHSESKRASDSGRCGRCATVAVFAELAISGENAFGRYPWKQLLVPGFGDQHRCKEVSNPCREKKECLDCGDFCGYCASKWRQMASIPAVSAYSSTVRKRLITSS